MKYLLGIDVGTSGTKALLIDVDDCGRVIASSTKSYPLHTPKPMWAEQNPEDWWSATTAVIGQVISDSGVDPRDIKGVGLSGQMHGSVFIDDRNEPIRPAILWCDQRTQAECDWITDTVGSRRLIELISNPVLPGFTAGKIIWLRNNEPQNYEQVRKVLLPKDFIRLKLTGEYATEVSDASGTALFDVTRRIWAHELLDAIGIPDSWLPQVYESPEISGKINAEASAATGLIEGTPVVGGAGDQAAGAVGNGIVEQGLISSTIGTSGVVFAFADEPIVDPKLRMVTFCHAVPGKWHLMGCVMSAGGSLRWYRDTFADAENQIAKKLGVDPYSIICDEAGGVEAGCEGLIFLPYLTGERTPYPDANARGTFFGITLRHDKAHFARAVLEGVAYAIRDSFEILSEMNIPVNQVRASGGGARSACWRQIQADVTGHDHVTISIDEGPALGVALLAGVGTGIYASVEDACRSTIRVVDTTKTNPADKAVYERYYPIYRSLYKSLKDNFADVSRTVGGLSTRLNG